ncbi:MAG: nucleotidyltransferase domain-containing protein [Thermaerobacter sp.]|jgi:predicted nucleotidyltransferase|nr:nucleotidyltransferase domain-containing protein [Thermaerobacter sp.]
MIRSRFDLEQLTADRRRALQDMREEAEGLAAALRSLGAQEVYLFGSVAKEDVRMEVWPDGTLINDADLDLLAVMDTDLPVFRRAPWLLSGLYEQGVIPRYPVDLVVYTPSEFTQQDSLVRTVLHEGVKL